LSDYPGVIPAEEATVTISDDRLTSPQHLVASDLLVAFREAAGRRRVLLGIDVDIIVDGKPRAHFAEVYRLAGDEYALITTVPADGRMEFAEPFPFVLDMKHINS